MKNRFRVALGVFAIALGVRLLHVWQIRSAPFFATLMGDSRGYDEWAQRIAGGDWLGHDVFYQAPLYPYVLGAIYTMVGRSLLAVRIVQAVIGSASCVLLTAAGARLFSPRVGAVAGLILALYAPAIFFDGLLQKSTLDVFFVCLALWLLSRTINAEIAEHAEILGTRDGRRPNEKSVLRVPRALRFPSFFVVGLAMGGLALTRENALVLILVVAIWTAIVQRWQSAAIFIGGVALVLAPVAARNAYVGGGFYVTTSQAGPNFFIGNNPHADGTYQSLRYGRGAPEFERQDATELAEHALGRTLTPAEVSSYWTQRALDFIGSQPGAWAKLTVRKVALLFNTSEAVDTESQSSHAEWSMPLRILGKVGHFGVLVPLACLGLIATWPIRSRLWLLHAMAVAYAASVVAFYVFARYRYPLVPFLVLFAGAGVVTLRDSILRITTLPEVVHAFRPATLAAVAITAIVANWPMLNEGWMQAVTENNLGVALQDERRLDDATAHYRRAIAFRSDYAPAYSNLGTALRALGRQDDAVHAYEEALRLQPDFAGAHYNLANLLLDAGNPSAAAVEFKRALNSEPASAEVHSNLGIALAATGRQEEAISEFRRAIALDPAAAKAHRNLGDALSAAGAQAEAIASLKRAAELEPNDAAIQYDLGGALLEAGEFDAAITHLRAALRTNPNFPEAHNNLGIALASLGRLDEAIAEFRAALTINADFADAKKNLAMALSARCGAKC